MKGVLPTFARLRGERYLAADREAEVDRRIVAAYTREPQGEAWGDATAERLIREEPW
jgi:hypothetical protein